MQPERYYQPVSGRGLFMVGLALWVAIIVLTGTYLRVREVEQSTQMDWLVAARVAVCLAGGVVGLLLLGRGAGGGPGTAALMAYLAAAAGSAAFTAYRAVVVGYWLLLAGGVVLTVGLVVSAKPEQLHRMEKTWLGVMVVLLLKDALIGVLAPELQEAYGVEGPVRLGMGVTHANALGFGASVAFWLTFSLRGGKSGALWLLRALLAAIVTLSWSRNAIVSLVVAGLVRTWFLQSHRAHEGYKVRWVMVNGTVALLLLLGLLLSFNVPAVVEAALAFNRTASFEAIGRLSGRAEIWPLAMEKIFADPLTMLFGYGFGVSRLVLNDGRELLGFYAANAHNTLLEVALTTGLIGAVAYLAMVVVSLRWLCAYRRLDRFFEKGMAGRAATVVAIMMIHSVTESILGTRLGPVTLLWAFYLVALDREWRARRSLGWRGVYA
ncbi:MAG: O-antigen ligase family protein [Candidatus Oleimicrobiaceae bacterium]